MKIRHKETGKIVEIMEGAIYPEQFYEKVTEDDDIKVGEPKVEYVIEEYEDSGADELPSHPELLPAEEKKPYTATTKKPATKKKATKAKKGVKKNDSKKE